MGEIPVCLIPKGSKEDETKFCVRSFTFICRKLLPLMAVIQRGAWCELVSNLFSKLLRERTYWKREETS